MNTRLVLIAAVFLVGQAAILVQVTRGSDPREATPAVASTVTVAEPPSYTYIGSSKCKKCHIRESKTWAKTKMGKAFDILKPGNSTEQKEKYGLDPNKDFTTDAACLKCHTTGFGHEGGYAIPEAGDQKAVRKAKKLANVGCESCHGPGSAYIKVFEEIFRSKRKYKVEELYAVGLKKIEASTCTECHNEESPTVAAGTPFDFEARKDEDTHERVEMKQREE